MEVIIGKQKLKFKDVDAMTDFLVAEQERMSTEISSLTTKLREDKKYLKVIDKLLGSNKSEQKQEEIAGDIKA